MKKILSVALLAAAISGCTKENKQDVRYQVNDATSKAEWKGSAPDHFHVGSFQVTGSLTATSQGVVKSGDFTIPVSSIEDYDLPDPAVRKLLLDDLKSANFFNMVMHPNAGFHITKVAPYTKARGHGRITSVMHRP